MLRYVQRRALTGIVSILGISVIAFLLPRLAPGDPALVLMSDDATDEIIEETREFWGLNKPLYEQYYIFVVRAAQFDLGTSLVTGRSTIETVKDFFPNTIKLALVAWVWSVVVSIPLGVLAALHRNKVPDIVIRLFAMLGRGMPNFWLGIMLILLFAVVWNILPAFGSGEGVFDQAKHLILPGFVLGSAFMALLVRMVRSEMLEVLNEDYVRTARAKGLTNRMVIYRHALRNALIPVVTILGLEIGGLIGGSIITETVFAYPGLGRLTVQSIQGLDYPMVQTLVLIFALIYVSASFIVDVLYGYLDPRIRYQ
jgi:peptide/nickel transport system permease protein